MRLTVFGATGGTGRHLVRQALEDGHVVTAVARRPEAVTDDHPGLEVVKGDIMEAGSFTIDPSSHAVLFLAGPAKPGPTAIYSQGCGNVIKAMREAGVKRLVAVTAALVPCPSDTVVQRLSKNLLHSTMLRGPYRDHLRLQDLIRDVPLDWTIARPPNLHNRPARGVFRTAVGDAVRGGSHISREDLATALLRILPDHATHRQTVDIAY